MVIEGELFDHALKARGFVLLLATEIQDHVMTSMPEVEEGLHVLHGVTVDGLNLLRWEAHGYHLIGDVLHANSHIHVKSKSNPSRLYRCFSFDTMAFIILPLVGVLLPFVAFSTSTTVFIISSVGIRPSALTYCNTIRPFPSSSDASNCMLGDSSSLENSGTSSVSLKAFGDIRIIRLN